MPNAEASVAKADLVVGFEFVVNALVDGEAKALSDIEGVDLKVVAGGSAFELEAEKAETTFGFKGGKALVLAGAGENALVLGLENALV